MHEEDEASTTSVEKVVIIEIGPEQAEGSSTSESHHDNLDNSNSTTAESPPFTGNPTFFINTSYIYGHCIKISCHTHSCLHMHVSTLSTYIQDSLIEDSIRRMYIYMYYACICITYNNRMVA